MDAREHEGRSKATSIPLPRVGATLRAHRLVTKHLTALAGFLGRYELRRLLPLRLQRRAAGNKDEFDQIIAAFESRRREMETSLRESEQRFRDYAETASDWFWETGPDHRFTYFSELGTDGGKLIGMHRWDAAADLESEPEKWREHMATLERHEPFRDFVYKLRSLNFVSISGKPMFDAVGRFSGYRGVARDITQRKRAEEGLRRSEAYLVEAQRLTHTGSWAYDRAARKITYWAEETYRLLGFDPDAGIPSIDAFMERIHPEDRARARGALEGPLDKTTDNALDYRIVLPDGAIRNIREISHPVFDASGNLVESVGTVIDVTERKRAEAEHEAHLWFLESMDRINRAIQGTSDLEQMMSDVLGEMLVIFGCDRAWLVYPCDPEATSWRAQMEHTRPGFPGAFALAADLPVDGEVASVFQAARTSTGAVRFGPRSGRPVPAQLAERFNIQSMIGIAVYPKVDRPYMLGLHQCSSPRTWTAQEERLFQAIGRRLSDALTSLLIFRNLRASEARLEEAQRVAHVGYWDRDFDTRRVTWSDEAYRIFGLEPQGRAVTSAALYGRVHPEDRAIVLGAVAEARRGGSRYDVEYRVVRPDGEVRIVHSKGDVTRDESGRLRRMFGTVQDVTERRRAEQELRASERRYREVQMELAHVNRVTTMGQLTASIAHEVNQPIAATVTNAHAALRWLDARPPDLEEARQALARIVKDGIRAGDVIGRIRALVQKVPRRHDPVDINETIFEVIALTRSEVLRNSVSLQTQFAQGLPLIQGDRIQLQQVVLNFLVNAIEAMGGVSDGPRELLIGTEKDGSDGVCVTVQDSGPGLPAEGIERLFDAFSTTKPGGMGMGLSICRSIIEAHGGRVWATANAPQGAIFRFALPGRTQTAS
jgi:PAS domain S-box-containing protein